MGEPAIISGRLLASFFDAQAEPVPLTGRVIFTPRFVRESTAAGLHLPACAVGELDADGRFEVRLLTGAWSWQVQVDAKHQGVRLTLPCFDIEPVAGETLDFASLVPLVDPVTATPITKGEQGEKGERGEPGRDAFQLIPDPHRPGLGVVLGVGSLAPTDVPGIWKIGDYVG